MDYLKNCWFPLIWSKDLGNKPVGLRALGIRLVVFRDQSGMPHLLEDRCAHRGVALSKGHVIGDCIQCPYHGWQYSGEGRCTHVPSMLSGQNVPDFKVRNYQVLELGETIWFTLSSKPLTSNPPAWRHEFAIRDTQMIEVKGNYIHLMENLVDNPHAGFIHKGLIRYEPTQEVRAEITESAAQILIQTHGEKSNDSILFRLLGKRGLPVDHLEEYHGPSQMISTYSQRGYFAGVQSFIVPISEHETRWFFRVFLHFGIMTRIVFPIYARIVHRILRQDAEVVVKVDQQDRQWPGRRTCSTIADTPSTLVAKAAREFAAEGAKDNTAPRVRTINYLL